MKKKLISVMLCAAMATTMFSSVAVHAEGDDEGEIYMFISQPEYADAITTLIDEYKNVEPGVTINYETTQNDYPTLLKAKLNSGECPDIFSSTSGKEIETYKEYSLDLTGQPLVDAMDDNVAAAEIMGHIGNEFTLILSVFVQLIGHIVQGSGQVTQFVI